MFTYFISALLLMIALCLCFGCSSRSESTSTAAQQVKRINPEVEAHVFEDDAMLKGKEAIIGGTVENLADSELESVKVELELTRRGASETETRIAQLTPQHLAPGERGRYSLTVVTHDWSGARVVRLRTASRDSDIIFKSLEGAQRPLEPPPDPQAKISGRDSCPRPREEEFINTPENPDTIR